MNWSRRRPHVTTVLRSLRTGGPDADDAADEEEVEIEIDGGCTRAEPDVGIMSGGAEIQGATRTDNGKPIELTPEEEERISIEMLEAEADRAEDYDDGDRGSDDR